MSRISRFLENQRDKVVELQESLVALPALGPDNQGRGEKSKADFLHSYLRRSGFEDILEVNSPDPRADGGYRPNIIARIPGKNPHRTLWIISHMDVVPAGDPGLWDSDPFKLRVVEDLIFGRGVEDNHQGIVSSILAGQSFISLGIEPDIGLGVVLVADEETGNRHGLPFVLEEKPELFSEDDLYLVPDLGSEDSRLVEVAEKSILWLRISVTGRQCHASRPDIGINTLTACSDFVLRLGKLHDHFSDVSPLFQPQGSTFCPTRKDANVPNINTIPGKDVFYMDCRVLPHYSLDRIMDRIKSIGAEIESGHKVSIDYHTVMREQSAPFTDPASESVARLCRAIKAVHGIDPVPQGVGGGTVAVFLRRRGYNAAVWATLMGTAHQPNEFSSIRNTINDARVMAYMACPW